MRHDGGGVSSDVTRCSSLPVRRAGGSHQGMEERMGKLDGKVAIVTGGARGVGLGHARLLAFEGASVVVNDLGGDWDGSGNDDRPAQQAVDEITAAGGTAMANYDDVSAWEGGQRLVNQAIEAFGRLDILICNAG